MADTLEKGNIYFFYRPKVEEESPKSLEDIQRLFIVLSPDEQKKFRLCAVAKKRLPDTAGRERLWGFIDRVERSPDALKDVLREETYETKTRGEQIQPAMRPAGEGRYRIVKHEDHTHLAYALELPEKPKSVQKELNIAPEGSYIITVKNPEKPSPSYAGLPRQKSQISKKTANKV